MGECVGGLWKVNCQHLFLTNGLNEASGPLCPFALLHLILILEMIKRRCDQMQV